MDIGKKERQSCVHNSSTETFDSAKQEQDSSHVDTKNRTIIMSAKQDKADSNVRIHSQNYI
jgi:hypothetical protein